VGIVLGLAVIAGVGAGLAGQGVEVALLLSAAALLAVIVPPSIRRYAILTLAGLIAGLSAAHVMAPSEQSTALAGTTTDRIEARIESDPRSSLLGPFAEVRWSEPGHVGRRAVLFMPVGVDAGRGDLINVEGRTNGTDADLVFAERVHVVERAGDLELLRRRLRATISERILARVPGSPGSLALGLLIGDDSGLTSAERDDVRASGLSHLTAVSGSNVGMVIAIVAFGLRVAARRGWVWTGLQIVGIVVFVWLVGFDPPIVRAAIMGSLALVAIALGRPAHLLTLLVLSAAIMTALDPDILASLSFQLSFVSMMALALVGIWLGRLSNRWQQLGIVLASPAAAAIATAPLLAARFGTFSLGTIPANVVVGPIVAPATALAALVAAVPDWAVFGAFAGVVLWFLTAFVLEVARAVAGLPYSHWTFAPLEAGQTLAVYMLLLVLTAPLIPEVRALVRALAAWGQAQPHVAAATALTGLVMLAALAGIAN
jgi:competence protein ComEC